MDTKMKTGVAVLGMSCRFAKAKNYREYWNILENGMSGISLVPEERWDIESYYSPDTKAPNKSNSKWIGAIDDYALFDNTFFNITPQEAKNMDPQQRLLLEETWKCVEDSGYSLEELQSVKTSVYVGALTHDFLDETLKYDENVDVYSYLGTLSCMMSNRISYMLNLKGNSYTIEAACTSGLVGLHQAKQAILKGECDYAIVAGVNLCINPWKQVSYSKAHMLSSEGKCKTFAQDADGFVSGDGVAVVLLGKLEKAIDDKAHIYAVIKGSGVTHVGKSESLTAPSVEGQRRAVEEAFQEAKFRTDSVTYLESHGTGTIIGDTMEVEALREAYSAGTSKLGFCKIGSEKTNIGHTEAASGIAALVKVILMMQHKMIVPSINCTEVNPLIKFDNTPFKLAMRCEKWEKQNQGRYRAGINGFGFGGVNAHILLEDYIPEKQMQIIKDGHVMLLHAKTKESLIKMVESWNEYVESEEFAASSLEDICKTVCSSRKNMRFRTGVSVSSKDEFKKWLRNFSDKEIYDIENKKQLGLEISKTFVNNAKTIFDSKNCAKKLKQVRKKISDKKVYHELEQGIIDGNENSLVLSIYKTQRLFEILLDKNVRMPYVCGSGTLNMWNSLIACGMVSEEQVYQYLLKEINLGDMNINLPKIPYYDCKMKRVFHQVIFNQEYFMCLKQKSLEVIAAFVRGNLRAEYFKDILSLLQFQRSFQTGFKEWEKLYNRCGFDLKETMERVIYKNSNDNSEIALFVICTMIIKNIFQKKYSLQDEYHLNDTVLGEVTRLIQFRVLDKEDLIQFFLSDKVTAKQLATKAESNITLDLDIEDFPVLKEIGCRYFDEEQQFEEFIENLSKGEEHIEDSSLFYNIPVVQNEEELFLYFCLNGCDILWNKVYDTGTFQKTALPVYEFNGSYYGFFHNREENGEKKTGGENMSDITHSNMMEEKLLKYLLQLMEDIFEVNQDDLDINAAFVSELGLGSLECIKLFERLEGKFEDISPAVLYEYTTIDMLKTYLLKYYGDQVNSLFQEKEMKKESEEIEIKEEFKSEKKVEELRVNEGRRTENREIEIAIVGLSGRYPKSENTKELWKHLLKGENLLTEVPKSRWNIEGFYTEDKNEKNKSYTKWGGYLEDYDKFDHYFFNIAPSQAKMMDPQQRIFLETAYEALEDAGYTKETISHDVGVFVGATTNTYGLIAAQETVKGNVQCVDNDFYDIANRVSYFMDWTGPSMTIDSACSSSITAIHLAINAIKNSDCKAALVGSVSLTLHPNRVIQFCQKNMLLEGKDYYPFGNGDGGFVDSEGVGAILLKPYDDAIQDHDHIYAIIKGTSVNAGGRTSGYTVPNPKSQADLIEKAIKNAGISPRTIQYMEAHGTGTKLGDPIEIQGLTEVYRKYTDDVQFCSIGSVKSNIGHTIAAAGIAGLTKVLLQLKHKTLVKTLFGGTLNPLIKFEKTPFYIQKENEKWDELVINGEKIPRRAAISAFGAGGSNAHMIIEECTEQHLIKHNSKQVVFLLSAKSQAVLKNYVKKFIDFLKEWDENEEFPLQNVAYTLQTGRAVMNERFAFVTDNLENLLTTLIDFYEGKENKTIYLGSKKAEGVLQNLFDDEDGKQYIVALIQSGKQEKLAKLWIAGVDINWNQLYEEKDMYKMSLPTYPFERINCWIPIVSENMESKMMVSNTKQKAVTLQVQSQLPEVDVSHFIYENEWVEIPVTIKNVSDKQERTIVFSSRMGSELGIRLEQAYSGSAIYSIENEINKEEHIKQLCMNADHIIIIAEPSYEDELRLSQFAFMLTKYINEETNHIRISVITNQNFLVKPQDKVNASGASLYGFFAVIAKECMLDVRVYDIDEDCRKNPEQLFHLLSGMYEAGNEVLLALRKQKCYNRKLKLTQFKKQKTNGFRKNGTYLMVGGAGNLGLQFSVLLSKYYHANVILLGRRKMDKKIQQLLEQINKEGGTGNYIQGNVTEEISLKNAVEEIEQQFGKIHGVMNLAMKLTHKIFDLMSYDEYNMALKPKVQGSIAIANVFRKKELDFFLSFSSSQSYTNNIEYADYSAGSTYEDAYMLYLKTSYPMNCKVINWGYWNEYGEIASGCSKSMFDRQGQIGLTMDEGINVLEQFLASENSQVVVFKGEENFKKRMNVVKSESSNLNQTYLRLKVLCEIQMLHEFQREGVFRTERESYLRDGIKKFLHITDKFERVLEVLFEFLEQAGYIKTFGNEITVSDKVQEVLQIENIDGYIEAEKGKYPEIAPHLDESRAVLNNMMKIMRGEINTAECIFKNGSVDLIKNIYKENQLAASYGEYACDELEQYILKKLPKLGEEEKIRILEVGAGVGGISYYVLRMLEKYADKVEYVYTDISRALLRYGKSYYKYSFLKFDVLNIEKELEEQGYQENSFDVLIASNVLHATREMDYTLDNVCKLLRDNSKVIINEVNGMFTFLCPLAIFLDGWWLFSDPQIRCKNSPLLSVNQWSKLLVDKNFIDIKFRRNEDVSIEVWNQHLITGLLKKGVMEEPEKTVISENSMNLSGVMKVVKQELLDILEVDEAHFDSEMPFAESGVDSILAGIIISNINKKLSINIKVAELFAYPTIKSLASYIYNDFIMKQGKVKSVQKDECEMEENNTINQWLDKLAKGEVDASDISSIMVN